MARMGRDIARRQRRIEEERLRAQQRQQDALLQQQQEQERQRLHAELYKVDTGMGQCPNCGSRNLLTVRRSEANTDLQSLACCLGCLFHWLLFLLIPFLHRHYTAVLCRACGYEQRV